MAIGEAKNAFNAVEPFALHGDVVPIKADVDGGLIGGASLVPEKFQAIVKAK